jgi:aminoglycoside 3-N-acetyltransferase
MIITKQQLIKDFQLFTQTLPQLAPVLVHCDLTAIGIIDNLKKSEAMLSDYEAVLEEIFFDRPYLIPSFNYDFFKTRTFDIEHDLSQLGALPKYFSKKYPELRTKTPVFNFVIKNNHQQFRIEPAANCFGKGSTFDELMQKKGYVLLIGTINSNTFTHYVEEMVNVGYRYIKHFVGEVTSNGKTNKVSIDYRVRPIGDIIDYSFHELEDAINAKVAHKAKLGLTNMIWYRADEYFDFLKKKMIEDEFYLLSASSKDKTKILMNEVGYPFTIFNCEKI